MASRSRNILEGLRDLLNDPSYSSYVEVNRAYRQIGRLTHWNFLRRESTSLLAFQGSTASYTLDMSAMRRLTAIRFKKVTDQQEWKLLEEVPRNLYERKVRDNRRSDGTDDEKAPEVYHITGGPKGATILIAPTPDQAYTARVEWIVNMPELDVDTDPLSPEDYDDVIVDLAASYSLTKPGRNADEVSMGQVLGGRAMGEFDKLVGDVHPNRTNDIDRTPIQWMR